MTKSEKICNDIGEKFFCKDFVYENLKYFDKNNNKVELCDGLFEYSDFYIAIQIKERSQDKGKKSNENWLQEVVYKKACEQIVNTYKAIKNETIVVNDLYHQMVQINKDYMIYPIIIFDNPEIKDYKKIIISEKNLLINVFSIDDYSEMMNIIRHPYDILYYLQERSNWLKDSKNLPNFVMGDNENYTIFANIKNEKDFSDFFINYLYDGKIDNQESALRLLAIINKYKSNMTKNNPNYKIILKLLQKIEPKVASEFINRFLYAWNKAIAHETDYSKAIAIEQEDKKTLIVFFGVGIKELAKLEIYTMLCEAKQQQHPCDAVLLISFIGESDKKCHIDWIYYEHPYKKDEDLLNYFKKEGILPK